ncbi:glycerophosphodiester phosphodiesterase family protein [Nocardioides sp. R-C-SC26]|uniref:glycerophosphodiester phosphodiesterase family protein n=1 Tax=Nocardioides sp. R-C-SC26 TaxID=2870414 RepID=UPI001E37B4C5|nr:glycerophosphodiester phosphodiesterase family protein [Nocardioides sp. R-C-SC26]
MTPRTGRPYLDAVLPDGDATDGAAVLAFAHRGGVHHPELGGRENTIAAFRHAWGLGYRYLETDVHVSADGVLLAFHDDVLDRLTGSSGAVAAVRYEVIRDVLVGGLEPIPTLSALVDALPGARFNIDLKADGAVRPLADLVVARGLEDRVLVGSFSHERLREFRRLTDGGVATSASPLEIAALRAAPRARLVRRLARNFDAVQIPPARRGLAVLTRGLLARAHALGKHVHVWTIDDAAEMADLLDLGVDGLFTDRTDVLKDVLLARGQWALPGLDETEDAG